MEASKRKWKLKADSFSKMIVWFKDGNKRTFYSLDWPGTNSPYRDQRIGLYRFEKLVQKYGKNARTVEIYDIASGNMISKWVNGEAKDIKRC